MKTIYAAALSAIFGLSAASAEKIYFAPPGWQYYNDAGSYLDADKNPISPEDIDWATSDVVIWYNTYAPNDYSYGINGDWTINSMTFMPTTSSHYWWAQSDSAPKGATLKILDALNFYNAILPATGKEFHLNVGTINVDIQNTNGDEQSVFLYKLYSLTVANGLNIKQMGLNKDGSFSIDHTGYREDGVWKGGVSIIGGVNIADMSRFNAEYSVDFYTDGDFTAKNVSGEIQMNRIGNDNNTGRIGGIEITGNLTLDNVAKMNAGDAGNLTIGGNIRATDSDVDFHGVGRINNESAGGISIGGEVGMTNANFTATGNVPYMTVAKSFTMSADVPGAKSMNVAALQTLAIGGDLGLANVSFAGSEIAKASVGGNLSFNGDFDFRKAGNLSVNGAMDLGDGANAMIGAFKDSGGANANIGNAGLKVGGIITVNGGAKLGTWFNSDYGYDNFASAAGLNGTGEIYLNKSTSGRQDVNYASTMVFNGSGTYSFNGGIYHYDGDMNKITAADAGMKQNFVMNGTGTQTLTIDSGSNWTGTLTVNNGKMLLTAGGSTTLVDVELNGGIFASSANGSALVNNLAADGGGILAVDSAPEIFVAGDFTVGPGGMKILYDGPISETTVITDFFSWYSENDSEMISSITDAIESGDITLWVGLTQYDILDYNFDDQTLTLTFAVPEPAAAGAAIGMIALVFARLRRRK